MSKFLSRKFLLTVAAVAAALADHNFGGALVAVLAYLGVEGAADVRRAR